MNALDKIQFNDKGLIPVITQDFSTNEISNDGMDE